MKCEGVEGGNLGSGLEAELTQRYHVPSELTQAQEPQGSPVAFTQPGTAVIPSSLIHGGRDLSSWVCVLGVVLGQKKAGTRPLRHRNSQSRA